MLTHKRAEALKMSDVNKNPKKGTNEKFGRASKVRTRFFENCNEREKSK